MFGDLTPSKIYLEINLIFCTSAPRRHWAEMIREWEEISELLAISFSKSIKWFTSLSLFLFFFYDLKMLNFSSF